MLDGLEAVELKLSECKSIIDFRIDANTYKKEYLKTDFLIKSKKPISIEKLSISVQNFGAYSLCNFINFTDKGIPFLMTENIKHNYIDWNIQKYVDTESHTMLYKSHCKKEQVLVTMAGEYLGRVAVYDKDEVCSSNQAIAKITLKNGISPYIISTFLNSKHGQNQINRFRTITGQPNINMALIKSLLIPFFSGKFKIEIESLVKLSHQKLEDSKTLYKHAKEILLKELDLLDFEPSKDNIAIKSFSESFGKSGRLDSEYYQPKYDEIIKKIKSYKGGWKNIRDILSKNIKNGTTPKEIIKEYIKNSHYLLRAEAFNDNLTLNVDSLYSLNNKIFEKYKNISVQQYDILVSMTGTIGNVAIVDKKINAIINQNIVKLSVDKDIVDYKVLAIFMKTVGKQLLTREQTGNVQPYVNIANFSNLIVPIIDKNIQTQISNKIQTSFNLKKESKNLLETAKRAVEIAIEQNEAEAIKFIEEF